MNAIIIRHDLSEILSIRGQICTAPFRELKIISVHKLPGIPAGKYNILGYNHIVKFEIKIELRHSEPEFIAFTVEEYHHCRNHRHVHHYLQPVCGCGEQMGEVEVLFDELEEHLDHPAIAVCLEHVHGREVSDIRKEVHHLGMSEFRICLDIKDLRLRVKINGRIGDRGGAAEYAYPVILDNPDKPPVFGTVLACVIPERLDHLDPSLVGDTDKKIDLPVLTALILSAQFLHDPGSLEPAVYQIKVPVETVLSGGGPYDLGQGVVLHLSCPVVVETHTEHGKTVKDLGILHMLPGASVPGPVPDMEAFLKFVAGLRHYGGVNGGEMQLKKMDRIIDICHVIPYLLIDFLEEIHFYMLQTLADTRMVAHRTGGTLNNGNQLGGILKGVIGHPLAKLALSEEHMEQCVEHNAALKQFRMAVNTGADRELFDYLGRDYVEDITHVLELSLYPCALQYVGIHILHSFNIWYQQIRETGWGVFINFFTIR